MTTALRNIEAQYPLPLASYSFHPQNSISCHSNQQPLLNQWHHLIEAIRQSATKSQWITLINPPFIPNDAYLKEIGLGEFYVRIVQFKTLSDGTNQHIQRCLQNGKSSVVAVWSNKQQDLPDIILNERPVGCRALVFSDYPTSRIATVHKLK